MNMYKKFMKCKECSKEVKGSGVTYCSETCRKISKDRKKSVKNEIRSATLEGQEGIDFISCQWCGMRVKRIYGIHMVNHHPGKSSANYRAEFPNSPLTCSKDKEKTSANSGLHMKEDKYREMMRERVKGHNNPNHSSNTTAAVRKTRSPFSQEFVSYRSSDDKREAVKKFVKEALKDRLTETQYEYWVQKFNGNEELAKKAYTDRQRTFTIEKCVEKYGEERGIEIWKERQANWVNKLHINFEKEGDGRSPQSKWAKDIIKKCCEYLNIELPVKEKWISSKNRDLRCSYDFTYKHKIIEFNGDFWHAHPNLFEADEIIPVLGITATEKRELDEKKKKLAEYYGYEVLVVWESEYHKDLVGTIQKCIKFLND